MKISLVSACLVASTTAFSPAARSPFVTRLHVETATGDFGSAMPAAEDEFARFGVAKEDIALGVEISDLLEWVGTKEALIERIQGDVTDFSSREKAEQEASRLLMDAEVIARLVFYEKNKDEINLREEGNLGNPNTIWTYAVWLGLGATFPYLRRTFIDPKFESGEWDKFNLKTLVPDIQLPFGLGGDAASDAVAPAAADAVSAAVDSVSSAVDSVSDVISNAM